MHKLDQFRLQNLPEWGYVLRMLNNHCILIFKKKWKCITNFLSCNLKEKSFNSLSYRNTEITQNHNNDCHERLSIEFPCTKEKSFFVLKKKLCNISVHCIPCGNVNFPWCCLVLWKPFLVWVFVVMGVLFTVTVSFNLLY